MNAIGVGAQMKRRVVVLTESQWSRATQAMRYVRDMHDAGQGDGDVTDNWARANKALLAQVEATPACDIKKTIDAIRASVQCAIESACSCPGAHIERSDCHVSTRHKTFDRALAFCEFLEKIHG